MLQSEIKLMLSKLSDMQEDLEAMSSRIEDRVAEYEVGSAQEEDLRWVIKTMDNIAEKVDEVIQKVISFKA